MLTVKQLFLADGLDLAEDQIKLVRHVDYFNRSIQLLTSPARSPRTSPPRPLKLS